MPGSILSTISSIGGNIRSIRNDKWAIIGCMANVFKFINDYMHKYT